MDMAVMLVQAYLRVHGYFTVSEYPVLEARRHRAVRMATDIDILALRFPHSCQLVPIEGSREDDDLIVATPDAVLDVPHDRVDMIVGEVKVGTAELNEAANDPAVLRSALMRFGCCDRQSTGRVVDALLRDGRTLNAAGHQVRVVAFGSARPATLHRPYQVVLLGDVLSFMRQYLRKNWRILHHADFKDPAFSFMTMLEKTGAASQVTSNEGQH